jgi:hypothetical protein
MDGVEFGFEVVALRDRAGSSRSGSIWFVGRGGGSLGA